MPPRLVRCRTCSNAAVSPLSITQCRSIADFQGRNTVLTDRKERVMRESRGHQDIFVHRVLIVLPKLLHVTCAQDLRVNFQKLVSSVDGAIVASIIHGIATTPTRIASGWRSNCIRCNPLVNGGCFSRLKPKQGWLEWIPLPK